MSKKPISPAVNLAAPSLLGPKGAAGTLPYLFGTIQGGLDAFTDQPLALKPLLGPGPHPRHGRAAAVAYGGAEEAEGA